MSKEKKISLNQSFKNIIFIIVLAAIFFFIGKIWPSHNNTMSMSSDLLSQQIQSISELATVEYNYTNMGKFENHATFYGWKVPFSTKSFIVSYDGTIKAGFDMTQVQVQVKKNKVEVSLPKAKILSHEIDEKSIEVFDETKNIFNPIRITDYNNFAIDQKEKMEKNVEEKGLLNKAEDKAKTVIQNFIQSTYDNSAEYKVEVKIAE